MKSIVQLEEELVSLQKELDNFELDQNDYTECFEDYLNFAYEGIFGLEPADILRGMGPYLYQIYFDEYMEGVENEEDGRYLRLLEEIEVLKIEIEELEYEVCI